MQADDDLRDLLARAAYERDATQRWGASHYTPWSQLHEAVRIYYWDQQQWVVDVVDTWLERRPTKSDFGTIAGPMPNQDYAVSLDDEPERSKDLGFGWNPYA